MPLFVERKVDQVRDMPAWKATERLYLNKDRTKVIRGDANPEARSLLCGVGAEVPEAVCRQYGIGPYAEKPQERTVEAVEAPPEAEAVSGPAEAPEAPEIAPGSRETAPATPPSRPRRFR